MSCQVLNSLECEIISKDFQTGKIKAEKGASLLSFGHSIEIIIDQVNNTNTNISIYSDSLGIQLVDWGTNSDNENEIIDLLTQNFK